MWDHSKLKGLMRERGYSQGDLASKLGITKMSLWNKLHNRSDFSSKEIYLAMNALGIVDPVPYFFTPTVEKSQR